MENGRINPNTNTEPFEIDSVESLQDEEGAGKISAFSSEIPESLLPKLENNNNVETKTQGKEKQKQSGKQYPCKFCSKVFEVHQALGGHMNGHSKDERNRDKIIKIETWVRGLGLSMISSELVMQGTPTNRASCSSYGHPRETDGVHSQLGQPWTAQQSSQQIQSFQGLQTQQRQGLQHYQAPQRPQNYQAPQGPQSSQAPQGPQSYQAPQGSQSSQAPQGPQSYQAPQGSQGYPALQRPRRQLFSATQQRINFNPNMSNGQTAPARVTSNGQMSNSACAQGPHPQVEAQGQREHMPNPHNMQTGYRPTTSVGAPFVNGQMSNSFYAPHAQGLGRGNQLTGTPRDGTAAQCRPGNSPTTNGSFNHSEVKDPMDEEVDWNKAIEWDEEFFREMMDGHNIVVT